MPPEFMIKVDKLLMPDVCNDESRLLLLVVVAAVVVLLLLRLFELFCVIISFNLLRPNTKRKNLNGYKLKIK